MPIIFRGDDKFAYRDPTCYYFGGLYHLFFTVSEKDGGYMYNRVGYSVSEDLDTWRDVGTYTLGQDGWDFASGRLTAAFAMPLAHDLGHKYAVLFHGSRADAFPETHGNASLALAFTDDFKEYRF